MLTPFAPFRVPERLVLLEEAERAVVHRAPRDEAVVGVEVALDEAHAQPVRDQNREALRELVDHHDDAVLEGLRGVVHVGVLALQGVLDDEPISYIITYTHS